MQNVGGSESNRSIVDLRGSGVGVATAERQCSGTIDRIERQSASSSRDVARDRAAVFQGQDGRAQVHRSGGGERVESSGIVAEGKGRSCQGYDIHAWVQ